MWNTLYISSILFFIFVAGFQHYDRYITAKGELPLVSQFIDYVGFIRFDDPLEEDRSFSSSDSFEFQLEKPLLIQARLDQLNNQRMQILDERREFLAQIDELNVKILEEAFVYAKIIIAEGGELLTQFPEFDQLGKDIMEAKKITDPAEQALEFERIQNEIWETTGNVVDDPNTDIPRLQNFYASIQAILAEIPDVLIQDCATITLEECIETSEDVQSDLEEMIKTIASGPTFETTDHFTKLLFNEYKEIAEKYDSGERSLVPNSTIVTTEFKRLVMDLHKNFDTGVGVMRSIQKQLYVDQTMVLAYNKDFEKRMKMARQDVLRNRSRIFPSKRQQNDLFSYRTDKYYKNRYQSNSIPKVSFKSDVKTRAIQSVSQMSIIQSKAWKYQQKERQRALKQRIRDLKSRQNDFKRF